MAQPSPSSSGTPAPSATEIVTRPEPGLARGRWEAPVWVFWVVLAAVLLGSAAYVLRRMGILRFGGAKASGTAPSSSKKVSRP